jgi:large subunit ribosomal protein L13
MKTFSTKPTDIEREWWVVDAEGQTLGRLATRIAEILRGKHKPYYAPHLDCGDFIIVVNAEKIHTTGKRLDQKMYWRHSGYPGGIKGVTLREQLANHPERVIRSAVKGMLPSNSALGRAMLRKLKVYAGPAHPHEAQNPKPLVIKTRGKAE